MNRIAVIGGGAWGTALAIHASRAGAVVSLTVRTLATPARLPGLDPLLRTTAMPGAADAILLAIPTQHLRATLSRLRPQAPLVLCCKGIEAGTGLLPLEIAQSCLPGHPAVVLTGPNFAAEIAAGLPAASVVAGADRQRRDDIIARLGTSTFRLYGNADPLGAQLGGAAKNVIAIAAGAVIGAGYGENARAALVTRGLAELSRLILAQGGRAETAAGLSGLGDLVLTCTGPASRNFAYGLALGQGTPATGTGVVEGVATAPALIARAAGLDLPICAAVADLLTGLPLSEVLARLLARPRRDET